MNHGWRDLPIRAQVTEAVRIPTVVGHDVRAGLVAEARLGAAVGARDALFLPLGTGIAAALMVDGHVLSGGGWAGELGHVSVDPDGPPCACGGTGCLGGDRVRVGPWDASMPLARAISSTPRLWRSAWWRATRSRSPCRSGRCRLSLGPSSRRSR